MKCFLKGICAFFTLACFFAMLGIVGACEVGNISETSCLLYGLGMLGASGIFYILANLCELIKK